MPVRRSSAVHTLNRASFSDPSVFLRIRTLPCICSHLRHPGHGEQIGGLSGLVGPIVLASTSRSSSSWTLWVATLGDIE